MAHDARKHWTGSQVLPKLDLVTKELASLEQFSSGDAGKLPASLRKKLGTCIRRNRSLIDEIRAYVASDDSKLIQKFKKGG